MRSLSMVELSHDRDFGYASGLVILGKIDGDVEALDVPGPIEATIELLK